MRSNLFKYCAVILGIVMICFSSFSCAGKKTPAYLLVGSEDNGWVPSYRAYFSVDGDEAKKISKHRFESLSDSTVKDSTSGLFRDGKMIELPKNVTFRSVTDVYRLEN